MAFLTPELREEIIRANPLQDVMAEYGHQFKDCGDNILKTSCFNKAHADSSPSLAVYKAEQTFSCFGCNIADKKNGGIGSDVIAFIMYVENISFIDACKKLMVRAGIPMPEVHRNPQIDTNKDFKTQKNREFWANLTTQRYDVLAYLGERGITRDSIDKWRLGAVPYDYPWADIRGRLAFGLQEPTDSANAKTIAMAYRTMDNAEPKYINDPNSIIYNKSSYIYGLNHAAKAIRKAGYAIAVEGYVDTILAHQIGLEMTVGICGTAFTEEQIKLLKRYTNKILLWLDGDAPGQAAMVQVIPKLVESEMNVAVVPTPGNCKDPADFIKNLEDKEQVVSYLQKNAIPGLQFALEHYAQGFLNAQGLPAGVVYQEKVKALEHAVKLLESVQNIPEKLAFTELINQTFGVSLTVKV